jgi:adenylate cyclase
MEVFMSKFLKFIFVILIILLTISVSLNVYLIFNNISKLNENNSSENKEIERKWLINKDNIPFDLSKADKFDIKQTYISFSPEIRVRDINNGTQYILTIKSDLSVDGLSRTENEYYITEEEYNNFLLKKEGNTIYKTRYQIEENGVIYAVDIFHEQLDGLAYLEVEFENESAAKQFGNPDWVIKDVTDNINYKNGHLARFGIPKT